LKPLKLAITPGEPAGIGPDLLLGIAQKEWPVQLVAFADGDMLRQRAKQLHLAITLVPYDQNSEHTLPAGQLFLVDIKSKVPVISGMVNLML
jgi:4-hydroxythreonine-4-phosphate dehydrogenase